jgi:hypothetical protein
MFRYRAAAMLIRTTFPDVTMGLQTKEELEDSIIDVTPEEQSDAGKKAIADLMSSDIPEPGADGGDAEKDSQDPPFNPPTAQEQAEHREPGDDPPDETETPKSDPRAAAASEAEYLEAIDQASDHAAVSELAKRAKRATSGLTEAAIKRIMKRATERCEALAAKG